MSAAELLYEKAKVLPAPLQTEALHYIEFLAERVAPGVCESNAREAHEPTPVHKPKITTSPITGLPVIETAGPVITSEMVRELLADFP